MDKVGDAVKEFGIRAIDGSKGTKEGFDAIGLNADEMAEKFTAGGETANNAFAATIAGLAAMKNPVEQNAAGVALLGPCGKICAKMWFYRWQIALNLYKALREQQDAQPMRYKVVLNRN